MAEKTKHRQTRRRKRKKGKKKKTNGKNKEKTHPRREVKTARAPSDSRRPGPAPPGAAAGSPVTHLLPAAAPRTHALPPAAPWPGAARRPGEHSLAPVARANGRATPNKATSPWACATAASVGTSARPPLWMVFAKEGRQVPVGRGQQGPQPRAAETLEEGRVGRRRGGQQRECGPVLDEAGTQHWPSPGKDARRARGEPRRALRLAAPSQAPEDPPGAALGTRLWPLGGQVSMQLDPQPRRCPPAPGTQAGALAAQHGNALSKEGWGPD